MNGCILIRQKRLSKVNLLPWLGRKTLFSAVSFFFSDCYKVVTLETSSETSSKNCRFLWISQKLYTIQEKKNQRLLNRNPALNSAFVHYNDKEVCLRDLELFLALLFHTFRSTYSTSVSIQTDIRAPYGRPDSQKRGVWLFPWPPSPYSNRLFWFSPKPRDFPRTFCRNATFVCVCSVKAGLLS